MRTEMVLLSIWIGMAVSASTARAAPLGDAFTYQGEMTLNGTPLNGTADLECTLWDADVFGNQIGPTVSANGVSLVGGHFAVSLDFGAAAFQGDARWLQIAVRSPAGAGNFTSLSPRQQLTPAPNAIFARTAGTATDATQLEGQSSTFYRNASNLIAGTISDDRLSTNVCLLDREQDITDAKHFIARPTFESDVFPFEVSSNGLVNNLNADLLDGFDSAAFRLWDSTGFHIHNTNDGNVGIGTTTPISKLSVQGGLRVFDDLDEDVTFYTSNFSIHDSDTQGLAYRYMSDPEQQDFFAGGSSCMTIAGNGNIGLGTSQPTAMLHFAPRLDQTTIRMEADRYISAPDSAASSSATGTQIASTGAVWANPGQAGTLDGALAIAALTRPGSNGETVELELKNLGFNIPADATIRGVEINLTGQATGACSGCMGPYAGVDYRTFVRVVDGATLGTEDNSRAWGLVSHFGSSSNTWGLALTPATVNAPTFGLRLRVRLIPYTTVFDIAHPTGTASDCLSCAANALVGIDGVTVTVYYGSPALTHAEYTAGIGPSAPEFRISASPDFSVTAFAMAQSGAITLGPLASGTALSVIGSAAKSGGGTWAALSDARLKQNVTPLEGTLDRLLTLHGYTFEYTSEALASPLCEPGPHIGLIAQEVEQVFPDWVEYTQDGFRMVTERATTALLVEGLRDLRQEKDAELAALRAEKDAEIDSLREEVRQLRAELTAVKSISERLQALEATLRAKTAPVAKTEGDER